MMVATKSNNWLRAAVMTAFLAPATVTHADLTKPLESIGRLHGFCWGDGYHACKSSGIRPLADLPPKSNSAAQGHRRRAASGGPIRQIGSTFYDRFDAQQSCDARGCDAPGCSTAPCHAGLITVIQGSQVTRLPSGAGDSIASIAPLTSTSAKKRPIRPEPPIRAPQSSTAIAVGSKQPVFGFDGAPIEQNLGSTESNQPGVVKPELSVTPALIRPEYRAQESASADHRLELTKAPRISATPYYLSPFGAAPQAPKSESIADVSPDAGVSTNQKPGPARLGQSQGEVPQTSATTAPILQKPTRLGAMGTARTDASQNRPVVELAKRRWESSNAVIYQPTTTLR